VVLVALDGYTALVIVNSITRSGGHGGVFWSAVALLIVLLGVFLWLTIRVGRGFASRF
jgi:hypothetical protein